MARKLRVEYPGAISNVLNPLGSRELKCALRVVARACA